MTRVPAAKITQLASLDLHSRDIDACVLLELKENIVKRVWVNTWNERILDFLWFSMLVWQLFFSCWKWREFLSLYKVLNLRIWEKFLTIFYWACVMYYSFARLYIFVLFCFGLSACLLFFCCVFFFGFFGLFFNLPWMFDAFPWQNRSSSYVYRMLNIVTARRAQK